MCRAARIGYTSDLFTARARRRGFSRSTSTYEARENGRSRRCKRARSPIVSYCSRARASLFSSRPGLFERLPPIPLSLEPRESALYFGIPRALCGTKKRRKRKAVNAREETKKGSSEPGPRPLVGVKPRTYGENNKLIHLAARRRGGEGRACLKF